MKNVFGNGGSRRMGEGTGTGGGCNGMAGKGLHTQDKANGLELRDQIPQEAFRVPFCT